MHTSGQFRTFIERCFGGYQITGSGNETNINVVCPICYEANNFNYQKRSLRSSLVQEFCIAGFVDTKPEASMAF